MNKHGERDADPTHSGGRSAGNNSLIFMTQNASVETVAARMYKTERKDFMSRYQGGEDLYQEVKNVFWEGTGAVKRASCGLSIAREDSESLRRGKRPGRTARLLC